MLSRNKKEIIPTVIAKPITFDEKKKKTRAKYVNCIKTYQAISFFIEKKPDPELFKSSICFFQASKYCFVTEVIQKE